MVSSLPGRARKLGSWDLKCEHRKFTRAQPLSGRKRQSHPHAVVAANGDIVMVFNQAPRRGLILHPRHDPLYRNLVTRSSDGGQSWSPAEVAPNYDASGCECAGLTVLPGFGFITARTAALSMSATTSCRRHATLT
jgi:hypothetical protein